MRSLIWEMTKYFLFEDCMFTSMPDKDTSDGGVSCPGELSWKLQFLVSLYYFCLGIWNMCYVGFPLNLMASFSVHSKVQKKKWIPLET